MKCSHNDSPPSDFRLYPSGAFRLRTQETTTESPAQQFAMDLLALELPVAPHPGEEYLADPITRAMCEMGNQQTPSLDRFKPIFGWDVPINTPESLAYQILDGRRLRQAIIDEFNNKEEKPKLSRLRRQVESEAALLRNLLHDSDGPHDEVPDYTQPSDAISPSPESPEKMMIHPIMRQIQSIAIRALPPLAIAAHGLFTGVNAIHAQEPTPQDTHPGITIDCDKAAICTATVGKQADMYLNIPPFNTGDLANAAAAGGLIYPSQAGVCADTFEANNPLWLIPNPDGGRPSFHLPGGTHKLPRDCTLRLFREGGNVANAIKPEALSVGQALPVDQKPTGQLSKLFDCLATISVFSGIFALGEWHVRKKYRGKK